MAATTAKTFNSVLIAQFPVRSMALRLELSPKADSELKKLLQSV
jgi:hypothetical protein